jgi:hypothetical protein
MKLQTVVTETKDIDIELPVFWKKQDEEKYIGIIDELNCIKFNSNEKGDYKSLSHLEYWLVSGDVREAYSHWEKISEETFLEAHSSFLSSLSMKPVLIEKNTDDLKGVLPMSETDQEIENELNRTP